MLFNRLGFVLLLLLIQQIQSKSIFSHDQHNPGMRILGEECQSDDHCRRTPVDGTKICQQNQCQCSQGYIPIDSYRCLRDFVPTSSSIESEDSAGYGSLCTTNDDCQYLTVQLECFRGTCVCLEGYVPLGKYLCYDIRGQGAPIMASTTVSSENSTCLTDDDCQGYSSCLHGKCQCWNGYIQFDDRTCLENDQILLSKESSSSIHYRSLLGGQCVTNENCQTIDARCVNQICLCPLGSFPIDEWNCLKDSDSTQMSTSTPSSSPRPSLHLSCLFNDQCLHLDSNSHCQSGRCICNSGYEIDLTSNPIRCISILIHDDTCD